MSNETSKIFETIASAASEVVDEAKDVAQSAGKVVSERYGSVKLRFELAQLQESQNSVFSQIGRTLFLIHSGVLKNEPSQSDDNSTTPQQLIDDLLLNAAKLDAQIDVIQMQIASAQSKKLCSRCKNACLQSEAFCSACGNKL